MVTALDKEDDNLEPFWLARASNLHEGLNEILCLLEFSNKHKKFQRELVTSIFLQL
jgi:hypothetical protein